MNKQWRPSWTWRCLQSACRCTGPTRIDPPLLEFVLGVYAPRPTSPLHVHSLTTLPSPFGQLLPHSRHVPSLWFRTTSTVSSVQRPRVYCTTKPDEVRYVSRFRAHQWPTEADDPWVLVPFPATRFTPLEEYRSPVAVPRHRGRYPLVVLSVSDRSCAETPERPAEPLQQVVAVRVPLPPKHWVRRSLRRRDSRVCPVEPKLSVAPARPAWLLVLPSIRSLTLTTPAAETAESGPLPCVAFAPKSAGREVCFPSPPKLRCSSHLARTAAFSPADRSQL